MEGIARQRLGLPQQRTVRSYEAHRTTTLEDRTGASNPYVSSGGELANSARPGVKNEVQASSHDRWFRGVGPTGKQTPSHSGRVAQVGPLLVSDCEIATRAKC